MFSQGITNSIPILLLFFITIYNHFEIIFHQKSLATINEQPIAPQPHTEPDTYQKIQRRQTDETLSMRSSDMLSPSLIGVEHSDADDFDYIGGNTMISLGGNSITSVHI